MGTSMTTATIENFVLQNWPRLQKFRIDFLSKLLLWEIIVSKAVALSFFATNINLGRWMIAAAAIAAPRHTAFGILGISGMSVVSDLLSKNDTLKNTGMFTLNGWFLGLAIASFYPANELAFVLLMGLSFVAGMSIIVLDRFLRNWDLPQLVLAYVIAIWTIQLLSMYNPMLSLAIAPSTELAIQNPALTIMLGSAKGFGQIFFQNNVAFSVVIFAILAKFRVMPVWALIAAPISATSLAYLVAGNHWAVTSGLTSFSAILLVAAFQAKFVSPTWTQLGVVVVFSGLFELIALQLAVKFNIFALSAAYVGVIWIVKLLTETTRPVKKETSISMPW
ncbi:MAG: urea transporter [Proteobacteria bacterium]|nr:urea transporter [Pseudomonadota bacterium]